MQIQVVSPEHCREGVVQNWIKDAGTMLVVSPDGIVFYKDTREKIYINEFETHPKRYEFPNNEPKKGYYFNSLFEEGKPYLVFIKGTANYHINMFINDGERTLSYYNFIIYSYYCIYIFFFIMCNFSFISCIFTLRSSSKFSKLSKSFQPVTSHRPFSLYPVATTVPSLFSPTV